MNIAGVTIAGASIAHNVGPKATAVEIADAKLHTVGSVSVLGLKAWRGKGRMVRGGATRPPLAANAIITC
jgi:hypothetical protein